jgi:hypothetical protein
VRRWRADILRMMRTAISTFCLSTSANAARSTRSARAAVFTTAVTCRGWSSSSAISPKKSPGPNESVTSSLPVCKISICPYSMMNMSLPVSPCLYTTAPAGKSIKGSLALLIDTGIRRRHGRLSFDYAERHAAAAR